MLDKSKTGYRKFKLVFYSFFLIFGMTLIISYVLGMDEMERGLLYLVLGIGFTLQGIFGLFKNIKHKPSH